MRYIGGECAVEVVSTANISQPQAGYSSQQTLEFYVSYSTQCDKPRLYMSHVDPIDWCQINDVKELLCRQGRSTDKNGSTTPHDDKMLHDACHPGARHRRLLGHAFDYLGVRHTSWG